MKKVAAILIVGVTILNAQTPGAIISPSSPSITPLNPNGDSWTTACACAYSSDDQTESEISWTAIPQVGAEVSGDLSTGGACGNTDIMDNPSSGSDATYVYFSNPDGIQDNGDEFMMYRMRIAKDPGNGNFGFSVLMDIDGQFGTGSDANAVTGNPGFEIEIRVKNGGGSKGVYVDNVDGLTSGTTQVSYSLSSNTQKSYALTTNSSCTSNDPVFYDFFIPFSDLTTYFGVTSSTGIRLVGATSINGSSSLSNGKSDIAGVNDGNYANTIAGTDAAYTALVNSYAPVTSTQASGGGVLPVELINFDVELQNKQAVINWITATEVDVDRFEIYHASDNLIFNKIGEVAPQNVNQNATMYEFIHSKLEVGNNYFKLVELDVNGNSTDIALDLIHVDQKEFAPFTIQNNQLVLTNPSDAVQVFNMNGQLVNYSSNQGTINLNDFSKGVYFIVGNQFSEKIYLQ